MNCYVPEMTEEIKDRNNQSLKLKILFLERVRVHRIVSDWENINAAR